MSALKPVYALSISGRLTLEMHSLNNEGGEGNQTMTRMVALVDTTGQVHKVNAISGDMFKHIQAEYLFHLASEENLPLCEGCKTFRSDRILGDKTFMKQLPNNDEEALTKLAETCVIDELEGTLIAKGNKSIPRKSIAEFSWVVGIPELVRTESYFHIRFAQEHGGDDENKASQPIFHRPASSGIYASVATFELARIGLNDISKKYVLGEEERLKRYRAFLKSVLYTYIQPAGAMRGTQNPHILNFEGVVTVSHQVLPAPTISPLAEDYIEQIQKVAEALDSSGAIKVLPFQNMFEFASVMQGVINSTSPYTLFKKNGG